ncbi:transposase [Pseudomonas sp. App30]|uniref:IS110 family transposase n=1 Tax=Pseudomonas sp. App30 TaxID=3068990 RepID=UPI003A8049C1
MISWLGIDVAKSSLAVWLRPQDISFNVPNNSTGYAHLIEKLSGCDVQKVLLEATGGYERGVMAALRLAGFTVVRVNPRRARAFAEAIGKQAKTDPIDAQVLAQFAETLKAAKPQQDSAPTQFLRELVQQRERFVQQRDDDRRRLKQAQSPRIIELLEGHIAFLKAQILELEKAIEQTMQALDAPKVAQLTSVKGLGTITAASLMAYLPELGELDRHQIAGLAGLAPYNNDSGNFQGKRKICGGRSAVRRVLYMSCWTVIRYDASFKARYEGLRDKGKSAKVALVACMRVLLVRLNAMLRDGTAWRTSLTGQDSG